MWSLSLQQWMTADEKVLVWDLGHKIVFEKATVSMEPIHCAWLQHRTVTEPLTAKDCLQGRK